MSNLRKIYQQQQNPSLNKQHINQYAILRANNTFNVCQYIFDLHFNMLNPIIQKFNHVLDLGCGTGASLLSFYTNFSHLTQYTGLDNNIQMLDFCKQFLQNQLPHTSMQKFNLSNNLNLLDQNLQILLASYSLNEINDAPNLIKKLNFKLGIIIFPTGLNYFKKLLELRQVAVEAYHILAPCLHQLNCPYQNTHNWCEFNVNFMRTKQQQQIKKSALNWQKERFNYLILLDKNYAKNQEIILPQHNNQALIIKYPLKKSGHVILDTCTHMATLQRTIVTKQMAKQHGLDHKNLTWGKIINMLPK